MTNKIEDIKDDNLRRVFEENFKSISSRTFNTRLKHFAYSSSSLLTGIFRMERINIYTIPNELFRIACPQGVYLEIGVNRGASLICSAYQNSGGRFIGIDDFRKAGREKELLETMKRYEMEKLEYINAEALVGIDILFTKEPNLKIDMFYFDASHDYKSQTNALNKINPYIKDGGYIFIDDMCISGVKKSMEDFVENNSEIKCIFHTKMDRRYWHNGWCVLKKEGKTI